MRDTLHGLHDGETWFQEIIRKIKDLLNVTLNIVPGILSANNISNDSSSILSMFTKLRQDLNFKYPVASYYVDWRIILIIQHNLFEIINKKFGEMILMELFGKRMD